MEQATFSAGQSGIGYKRARDIAAPAHLGAHSSQAAHPSNDPRGTPWRLALPQSLKQPPRPTSTPMMVKTRATARLFSQEAAQAAEEAWQQTIGGLQGPGVTKMSDLEHPNSASQDEDSEDMDFSRKSRLSAPQLQAQLSRLMGLDSGA